MISELRNLYVGGGGHYIISEAGEKTHSLRTPFCLGFAGDYSMNATLKPHALHGS